MNIVKSRIVVNPPKIIKFCKFLFTIQNILLYLELEVKKMGRKKREHKETDYVNNAELKQMVIEYNDTNPADNGEWLDRFEKTMKTKKKLDSIAPWIALRREKYSKPREYTPEFEKLSNKLFCAIEKIVRGRVACFTIPQEEKEDLIQECLLAVLKYINRYREDLETSAFSYITQIINNAIMLYMGNHTDSLWCRIPWNTLTDEHNALLYGVEKDAQEE